MTSVNQRVFSGMRPKIGARLLRDAEAQDAVNAKLFGGELGAWGRPSFVATPSKAASGTVKSIFRMNDGVDDFWLNWLTDVDCVRGAVAGDESQRIYFTGDGEPRVSNLAMAISGADFPTSFYVLGVFPPATAPTVGHTGGAAANVTYAFKYTFVTQWGEESRPSAAATHTAPSDATSWDLTGMQTAPSNSYAINSVAWSGGYLTFGLSSGTTFGLRPGEEVNTTLFAPAALNGKLTVYDVPSTTSFRVAAANPGAITDQTGTAARVAPHNTTSLKTRIYVSLSGTTEAEYQLWAEITTAATYSAAITASALGEIIESDDYAMPPVDMKGIREMPNGMAVAFSKNEVLFAEPYKWHAWPDAYRQTVPRDVVGLGVYGSTVVAATKALPYAGTGSTPENIVMTRVDGMVEPCSSKRGVVSASFGVLYPSPNGIVLVGVGGSLIATEDVIDKDDWANYEPTTLVAACYRDRYFGWYGADPADGRGLVFDRSGNGATLVSLTYVADAAWADPETGELYIVHDGEIKQWGADEVNILPFDWRSKVHVTQREVNLSCARVVADFDALDYQDAIDAQIVADQAYNASVLGESESWPGQGVTRGEFGGAMFGEYVWGGSRLRNNEYPDIDDRYLLFRLYADGELVHTENIADRYPFRLEFSDKARDFEIAMSGNILCYSVEVADSMNNLGR